MSYDKNNILAESGTYLDFSYKVTIRYSINHFFIEIEIFVVYQKFKTDGETDFFLLLVLLLYW